MKLITHPSNRHWCCGKNGACVNGRFENMYCRSAHPSVEDAFCTSLAGHKGPHAGFLFSISTPETWQ